MRLYETQRKDHLRYRGNFQLGRKAHPKLALVVLGSEHAASSCPVCGAKLWQTKQAITTLPGRTVHPHKGLTRTSE